ncbi:MAG: hypothetical protein FVQ78_05835 [Solirubrobacterales bacterium]|nr:hypothetical protein [Solirubrobacterales bacterium]
MRATKHLGFQIAETEVRNDILVPHYYDPELPDLLEALEPSHHLVSIGELIEDGSLELRQGRYIGKLHYGTGRIPYIRTSDIANWELRSSPKHGVSDAVWREFHGQQDVKHGDVLLVHEGTYLIGTCAPVTRYDLPLLFQHHLAKLRLNSGAMLQGPLLAAVLGTPVVQRQIRSKQLTADIIDSIVGRLQEVVLPIPRDEKLRADLTRRCSEIYEERAEARSRLSLLMHRLDDALATRNRRVITKVLSDDVDTGAPMALLGEKIGFRAFKQRQDSLLSDILIPAYYDPTIGDSLDALREGGCRLVTIKEFVDEGVVSLETGDEVGRLAYGSGDIPFVRTSDLATWELKLDPKQRVSRAVFDSLSAKQSARPEDLLVVRDGTYLVGTAAMVSEADMPLLFSGGVYRIRVERPDLLDPYLLLVLLWSAIVRRQVRAKRFTRDVIDTLGRRFEEVVLPLPTGKLAEEITSVARQLLRRRIELRDAAGRLGGEVEQAGQ